MATNLTGQSVRDLQEMLAVLSIEDPRLPRLVPDGRFGEQTLEAVMVFQRDRGLPVTGVVDLATWEAIREAYEDAWRRGGPPAALRVMEHGKSSFQTGDQVGQVPLLQAMFGALSEQLEGFEDAAGDGSGFQAAEEHNTRLVQRASGQQETGVLDRAAWDTLSRLYQVFVTRGGV